MISLKPGVKLKDLVPQISLAIAIAHSIFPLYAGGGKMTVTSCNDSKHKVGSLHYLGRAVDIRFNALSGITPADRVKLARLVRNALGAEFDVLHEYIGTDNEHLHLEWDPK